MRVFISFAHDDANLAAQLEAALRRNDIDTWSALDIVPGKNGLKQSTKRAPAQTVTSSSSAPVRRKTLKLRAEWRSLLRNDWESKKPLIPVILEHGGVLHDLPPFLRNRRAIFTTNLDDAIREVRYLIEHPTETMDHSHEQQSKVEWEKRRNELKDYALSLKQEGGADGEAKIQ